MTPLKEEHEMTTSGKTWRIAMIGCGRMANVHATQLPNVPEAVPQLAVDMNPEQAENFARTHAFAHTGTDWREALQRDDVDIVIVCTYADTHHEISKAALEHGKHVLCEKPYSMRLEEIQEIRQTAQRTGGKFHVGFMLRYSPAFIKLKEMCDAGMFGPKPWFYRMTLTQGANPANPDKSWQYFANLIHNAGSTVDCGIHYVDILRWFTGEEITHVGGVGVATEPELRKGEHNLGLFTMNLSGGSAGWVEDNWSRITKPDNDMELIGAEGRISFKFNSFRSKALSREGHQIEYFCKKNYRTELVPLEHAWGKQTHKMLQDLIRDIEENRSVDSHIEDVYKATEVALAANVAVHEKRIVTLPLPITTKLPSQEQ
jgi:predicted dehydrogenase